MVLTLTDDKDQNKFLMTWRGTVLVYGLLFAQYVGFLVHVMKNIVLHKVGFVEERLNPFEVRLNRKSVVRH